MNEQFVQIDVNWQWAFDDIFNTNTREIAREFGILSEGQGKLRGVVHHAMSEVLRADRMKASEVVKKVSKDDKYGIGVLFLMVHHGMLRPFESVEPSDVLSHDIELISTGSIGTVVESAFGLQMGDDGLDFLFGGGLLMPEFGGITLALEGDPGSGKTTLATQIIFALLQNMKEKKIGVYISVEERINELRFLMESFGFTTKTDVRVFSRDRLYDAQADFDTGKCVIVLTHLPEKTLDAAIDLVEGIKEKFGTDSLGAFVVDGINALEVSKEAREELRRALQLAEQKTETAGIFVAELDTTTPELTQMLRPLVDIHIKLGTYEVGVQYSSRYLEIVKCRTQMHVRGQQGMVIRDAKGIYILPSVAAQQSRIRDISYIIRRNAKFGIDGLTPGDADWRPASTTILSGPPGTKKFVVALHFLAAGLTEGDGKGSVMMLSPRKGWSAIEILADEYPYLNELKENRDRIITIDITNSFVTPNNLVWKVFQKLQDARRNGRPVVRAIFDDYRQLPERFPLLSISKPLMPGLIRLFENSGVTALFTHDMREQAGSEKLPSSPEASIAHLADNIIQLSHDEETGQLEICITKIAGAEEHKWRKTRPVIYENHKLYVGNAPVNVQIHLFSDTPLISELNQSFKARIQNRLKDVVIEESPINAYQHQTYLRDWQQHALKTSYDVCLIDVDEYFLNNADLAEIFIPIDCIDKNTIVQKAVDKGVGEDGKIYLLPRYIDMGLWAYRHDVLKEYEVEPPCTWSDVSEIANKIKSNPEPARKIIGEDIRIFDFGGLALESINCGFIEALYNNGGGIWRNLKGKPSNIDEELILDNPQNAETLILLLKLLDVDLMRHRRQFVQSKWKEIISNGRELQSKVTTDNKAPKTSRLMVATNAIFYRHWYTSLAELLDEFPNLAESLTIQTKMPSAVSNRCISITGEWYIGVATCSNDEDAALSIMQDIISPESDAMMISSSAALPLLKNTYESAKKRNATTLNSSLRLNDVIRAYELPHAYSRREIYGYNKMAPLLSKCFERIITLNPLDDELLLKVQSILSHYAKQIRLLLKVH